MPISLEELGAKIEDPDVSRHELSRYFRLRPNPTTPFQPEVELDPETVDAPATRSRDMLINFLNERYARRRRKQYRRRMERGWGGLHFVAEGDSWFQYPHPLEDNNDIIDYIERSFPVYCVSAGGDTLKNMLNGLDDLIKEIENLDPMPNGFLFSGGGNEIAGPELAEYLREYEPGFQLESCIAPAFDDFLERVRHDFKHIFEQLTTCLPLMKMFCHGYDYPYPKSYGSWLGPQLNSKNIPEKMWRPIIGHMIDRFNQTLAPLAGQFPGQVYYVDCRDIIGGPSSWRDELHGTQDGVGRVARKFEGIIREAFGAQSPHDALVVADPQAMEFARDLSAPKVSYVCCSQLPAQISKNSIPHACRHTVLIYRADYENFKSKAVEKCGLTGDQKTGVLNLEFPVDVDSAMFFSPFSRDEWKRLKATS